MPRQAFYRELRTLRNYDARTMVLQTWGVESDVGVSSGSGISAVLFSETASLPTRTST